MSERDQYEQSLGRVFPDGANKDATQAQLTQDFIGALLLRGGDTPDAVAERFGEQYAGVLRWLGEARQDEILRAGMREANVDLSHWLAKEGE